MRQSSNHSINDLFKQLGLDSSDEAIAEFVESHQPVEGGNMLEAEFWSESQKSFLDDALNNDAAWALAIDDLNARLMG